MDEQHEEKVPHRVDDPRDGKGGGGTPRPQGGKLRGVGYRLLAGARTTRGHVINQDAHPTGVMTKDEANAAGIMTEAMATRWPDYARGYDLHSEAGGMLSELWAAGKIPGLSPQDHLLYDGVVTAEEEYDFRATKDPRVLEAFGILAGLGKPAAAPGFDIAKAISALPADQRAALGLIVAALQPQQESAAAGKQESSAAPGGTSWGVLLAQVAPIIGRFLDGEKPTAMDLLALLPVVLAIQEKRNAEKGGDA